MASSEQVIMSDDEHIQSFGDDFKEYQRRVGVADQKGTNFEIKMNALVYLRALRTSRPFRLAVNDAAAGDFDDIVYTTIEKNSPKRILIQLKHRNGDVNKSMLSSASGKLSLNKYFKSVQKGILAGHYNHDFFVLFTNANINGVTGLSPGYMDAEFVDLISTAGNLGNIFTVDINDHLCVSFKDEPGATEFTQRFFIFCNQASVHFLDELIKQEFIKIYNGSIPNYKIIHSIFLNKIEDWWGRTGTTPYLTENWMEWKEIIRKMGRDSLMLPRIKFNNDGLLKLAREITDSENTIVHIKFSCSDGILRNMKVLQALSKPGSPPFIFIGSSEAEGSLELAVSGWADLFLIDLSDKCYNPVLEQVMMIDSAKKIILISGDCHKLVPEIADCLQITDSLLFDQLDDVSQQALHKRLVNFQRAKMKLQDLDIDNLLENDLLISLLTCKDLVIGSPLPCTYASYISRTVSRNISITKEVFFDEKMDDLFYVADVTVNDLQNMVTAPRISAVNDNEKRKSRYMAVSYSEVPNIISRLESNERSETDPSVHILQMKNNSLHWLRSFGDCRQLCKYIEAEAKDISDVRKLISKCKTCKPQEEYLTDVDLKTVVVTGEPGIGKSFLLTRVADKLKELHPTHWVIVVKLSETLNSLQKMASCSNVDLEDVLNILCSSAGVLGSDLGTAFLKDAINRTGRAFILCDAFDEISPRYTETVISMLKLLQQSKVRMLFVTSRRMLEDKIERDLHTKVFVLQPFTELQVESFFKQVWGETLAIKVLSKINDNLYFENGIPVSSFPLHIRMIVEAYSDIVKSDKVLDLPKVLNINDLIERFVESKLKIFYGEKLEIKGVGSDVLRDSHRKTFMELHMLCSLRVLNICDELPSQLRSEISLKIEEYLGDIVKGKEKTGVIDGIVDGNPQFIHRLFAEYFAGLWLAEHKHEAKSFILSTYFTSWFKNVYEVYSRVLAQGHPLHLAVLNKDFAVLENLRDVNERDKGGRTALHLAVLKVNEKDQLQLVKLLLDRGADLEYCDSVFEMSPLYYAVKIEAWDVAIHLLKYGAYVKENIMMVKSVGSLMMKLTKEGLYFRDEFSSGFEINWPVFENNQTVLHVAAHCGSKQCVKDLIKRGADITVKDLKGNTPLHLAVKGQNVSIVRLLLTCGANPCAANKKGVTPLHIAVALRNGSLDVIRLLLDYGALTTAVDNIGDTPLHKSAISGNEKAIKVLMQKAVPMVTLNKYGNTPLHESVYIGYLKATKALLRYGVPVDIPDSVYSSALHNAVITGNLQITKLLLDSGASIMMRNKYGNTALYLAIKWRQREVVTLLLDRGAIVDCANERGNTALHEAIRQHNLQMMHFLIERGSSVNKTNNIGNSPLHMAVFWKNYPAVKLLLDSGATVNVANNYGDTPLHVAVRWLKRLTTENVLLKISTRLHVYDPDYRSLKWQHPLILKCLLSNGASTSMKNLYGETPLHEAAKWPLEDTVTALLMAGAYVNSRSKSDSTPLHIAARWNNSTVARLLIDAGAQINAVDNEGDTPLHIAAQWQKTEVLQLLLKCGANVTCENKDRETPLHLICVKGMNSEVLKLLKNNEFHDDSAALPRTPLII